MSDERARVELLARILGGDAPGLALGIGDDAALLSGLAPGELLVASVDASFEGVHFTRALCSLRDAGFRATQAAASDLAAMGARPVAALAALGLPPDVTDEDLEELARGQREACEALGLPLAGGNLSRATELSITTTVLGAARRTLGRAGARPGDALALGGPVGLAAAGLAWLRKGREADAHPACVEAWRRPRARLDLVPTLDGATAAIDVSDGLARDAGALARASGVALVLDERAVLAAAGPPLAAAARDLGASALALALEGGEDYALLATFDPARVPEGFTAIGRARAGAGLALAGPEGERPLEARGFDHFGGSG